MAKYRDELLVHGYIREQKLKHIPIEIIELFLEWYHSPVFIEYFNSKCAEILNDEKTLIRYSSNNFGDWNSCYASIIMPSFNNNTKYEYTIKILSGTQCALGMVDALFHQTGTFFYNDALNKSKYYALYSWGGGKSHDESLSAAYGCPFNRDHPIIVKVIYNAYNKTLSYNIKDKHQGIAFGTHKDEVLSYRLAIYLKYGSKIELIDLKTSSAISV